MMRTGWMVALIGACTVVFAAAEPRPVPEIDFQDGEGYPRTLEDFRGRVVLLNLWASWCVPCRKEMPSLDRLQAQLGSADFEVVALSIDKSPEAVRDFYREFRIRHLALYVDPTAQATQLLGVPGIPATLLIDRDGRELWRLMGPAQWDAPATVAHLRKYLEEGAAP